MLMKGSGCVSLNDRKIKILNAIINDYIATAEPVGSRTIAKKYDMGISSATIRNEMSDLEEMGFIVQPHASAGRIPSDMGYRLYVDRLMKHKELAENDQEFLKSIVSTNISRIDFLMEETAKALSLLTRYTTIISEPVVKRTNLKQIRFMPLDNDSIMLIIATEENYIKNHIIKIKDIPEFQADDDILYDISKSINNILKGLSLDEINNETIRELKLCLGEGSGIIEPLIKAVTSTMVSAESVQVHLSGTKNILAFPEFSDMQKAKSLFQTLEEKDVLVTLLGENLGSDLQILIGNENSIQEMKDCSIITTSYKLGGNTRGNIGILGPTRMDYSQVVSVLNGMVKNIEKVLKTLADGKNDT